MTVRDLFQKLENGYLDIENTEGRDIPLGANENESILNLEVKSIHLINDKYLRVIVY